MNPSKTTTSTHQGIAYPQAPDLPQPLEIHPSVDPELAKGLIAAVEYINDHPEEFDMAVGPQEGPGRRGCVICHVERLSNWRRSSCDNMWLTGAPLGHPARIYNPSNWPYRGPQFGNDWVTNEGRIARIEHFLRTGE